MNWRAVGNQLRRLGLVPPEYRGEQRMSDEAIQRAVFQQCDLTPSTLGHIESAALAAHAGQPHAAEASRRAAGYGGLSEPDSGQAAYWPHDNDPED